MQPGNWTRQVNPNPVELGESCGFTVRGPSFDHHKEEDWVFARFWNRTEMFFWSKPGPLAGYQDAFRPLPTRVLRSAHLGLNAARHRATSGDYSGCWLESVGERPLWRGGLRASGGSPKIDWQLWYILFTLSVRQQNWRGVFRQTWRSREQVYPQLRALPKRRLVRYYPWVSHLTCVSHHQSAMWIVV